MSYRIMICWAAGVLVLAGGAYGQTLSPISRRGFRQPVRFERPLAYALSSGDAEVEVDGWHVEHLLGVLH